MPIRACRSPIVLEAPTLSRQGLLQTVHLFPLGLWASVPLCLSPSTPSPSSCCTPAPAAHHPVPLLPAPICPSQPSAAPLPPERTRSAPALQAELRKPSLGDIQTPRNTFTYLSRVPHCLSDFHSTFQTSSRSHRAVPRLYLAAIGLLLRSPARFPLFRGGRQDPRPRSHQKRILPESLQRTKTSVVACARNASLTLLSSPASHNHRKQQQQQQLSTILTSIPGTNERSHRTCLDLTLIETRPADTIHVTARHLDFLIDASLVCTTITQAIRTDRMTMYAEMATIATYPVGHED